MTKYDSSVRGEARRLRTLGLSLGEISSKLKIAKSTASLWVHEVELSPADKSKLEYKKTTARLKGLNTIIRNRQLNNNQLLARVRSLITSQFNPLKPDFCKILCSFLYWGEGSKTGYRLSFTNSDPAMISTFLKLLRNSFTLDENKFRGLVHVHEYHNELEIKKFWSKITNIPLSQFTKSYLKPNTKKVIRQGFKGTIRIDYYDSKIVNELKAIYNVLSMTI